MAALSLREAAEQAGVSKSTVFRAIRAGRLSAARDDDGNFAIDPSELFRVYPPSASEPVVPAHAEARPEGQEAIGSDTVELRVKNAEIAAELKMLRSMLEAMMKREDDIKAERERWAQQAERLALIAPASVAPASQSPGWWPFRRRA